MNFAGEMKAFNLWLKANYLPPLAQLLWFRLMLHNNECMWSEWFSMKNEDMMRLLDIKSEKTAIIIRDKLLEQGLIEYQKGRKGCPNKYKMISLYCKNYSESDSESDSISAVFPTVQVGDIYIKQKPNENETNFDNDDDAACAETITPQGLFRTHFGRVPTETEFSACKKWLEICEPDLVDIAFYRACKYGKKNIAYVSTVLQDFRNYGIEQVEDLVEYDMSHSHGRR